MDNGKQNKACVIMNAQNMHILWISPAAKNGNNAFENGLKSEGNEGVITDIQIDYSC